VTILAFASNNLIFTAKKAIFLNFLFLYIQEIYARYNRVTREYKENTMGLAASQARFLVLTARKSDVEMQGQRINQERLKIANAVGMLFNAQTNLDPDSGDAQTLQQRIEALQQIDKALELQLRRVDTQQQAIQTEIAAVQKVIDKNIDLSFKTFA
jgi:predicted  nucleic acid-binding Zn-ribbon protein